jgi:glycosyltransferase involved in cell wall biosynthesis
LTSKPSALFLAPEAPYPLNGGGALRTASLLEYLLPRYEVDVVVFREPGAPDPAERLSAGVRNVVVLNLRSNRRSFVARAVRNAGRAARRVPPLIDRFSGFGLEVSQAVQGRHYDLGIVEHFWCAPYHRQIAPACARTVLDLHNIESILHMRCAEVESGVIGVVHRLFHQAARKLEQEWIPRYSSVLTASQGDAVRVRSIAPSAQVMVYPNAIPLVPEPPHDPGESIVFSGNMEYHPNIDAVRYFRAEIWPLLRQRHPELVWRLVGRNPSAVRVFTAAPGIEVVGPVAEAVPELARSRIAVVPLRTGSGTRLKILEAWAAGLPVVSTSIGAEGLPAKHGEHLLLADSAADFAQAVTRLLTCGELCSRLGRAGRLLLEKEFTWKSAWESLNF